MGEGIGVRCKDCGTRADFLIGIGFRYFSLENVLPMVKGKARKTLKDILSNQEIHDTEYGHTMFSCPHCNTLHNRFYAKVAYGDGEVFETKFRCGQCRKPLVKAVHSIDHYNCRVCGSKALEQEYEMMWD